MKRTDNIRYVFKHKTFNNISNVYSELNQEEINAKLNGGYELLSKEKYSLPKGWSKINIK